MALLRPPVRRHRNDFSVHLTADQSELIVRLLDEMSEMLTAVLQEPEPSDLSQSDRSPSDPSSSDNEASAANRARLARLFPPAYSGSQTDPELAEREAEYQRLMREELVQSRLASIATVRECLASPRHLSEPQLIAMMQAINALRLVLGTILEITEDSEIPDHLDQIEEADDSALDRDDANLGLEVAYDFLSWLLEWTVQALSS